MILSDRRSIPSSRASYKANTANQQTPAESHHRNSTNRELDTKLRSTIEAVHNETGHQSTVIYVRVPLSPALAAAYPHKPTESSKTNCRDSTRSARNEASVTHRGASLADTAGRIVLKSTTPKGRSNNVLDTATSYSLELQVNVNSKLTDYDYDQDLDFVSFAQTTVQKSRAPSPNYDTDSTLSADDHPPKTTVASQGDAVLISFLAPDQHHVAHEAGRKPLGRGSESETSDIDMEGGGGVEMDEPTNRTPEPTGLKEVQEPVAAEETKGGMTTTNIEIKKPSIEDEDIQRALAAETQAMHIDQQEIRTTPPVDDALIDPALGQIQAALDSHAEAQLIKEDPTELPKEEVTEANPDAMDLVENEAAGDTANSLMKLAGGALQSFLATQSENTNGWTSAPNLPASPQSPDKGYNQMSPLPSMMDPGSSPNRDGKTIISLPSINSIDVLADLATSQDSPQKTGAWRGQSTGPYTQNTAPRPGSSSAAVTAQTPPNSLLPPTPTSTETTPRPPMQQQRSIYLSENAQYPHHIGGNVAFYPPIKDGSATSPQQAYAVPANPDSANLFATRGFERRQSDSYGSASTPQGPSTGGTLPAGEDDAETSDMAAVAVAIAGNMNGGMNAAVAPMAGMNLTGAPAVPGAPAVAGQVAGVAPMVPMMQGQMQGTPQRAQGGLFRCDIEGCRAPPFQTQYLLKYVSSRVRSGGVFLNPANRK
jgi:hypothetical protein